MPHLARHLALAACLTLIGSVADAAPAKRGKVAKPVKKKKTAAPPVIDERLIEMEDEETDDEEDVEVADDEDEEGEDQEPSTEDDEEPRPRKKQKRKVGFVDDTESAELVDAPVKIKKRTAKHRRPWNFAIGPNVWMASVDAKVSVGAQGISTAIDFFQLSRATKLGVPILAEARYKRFSFVADMLYGVIGVSGEKEIGPLMVKLDGTVKQLMVDGLAGYRVLGGDDSKLTFEARGGIRYARMAITGSVGLGGDDPIAPAPIVDAGADVLAGARATVRPLRWFSIAGTVDQSLFGTSASTWSAGVDANVMIKSRVMFAAGWRTMTTQKDSLSTVMHGPKFLLQVLF
jgi:hypothetical protein